MSNFGNLIGLVAGKVGKKKDVQKLTIMVLTLMSTKKLQESMNGLIGEFKSSSRKQFHLFGKRN